MRGKETRLGLRRLRETGLRLKVGGQHGVGGIDGIAEEGEGARGVGLVGDAEFPFVD